MGGIVPLRRSVASDATGGVRQGRGPRGSPARWRLSRGNGRRGTPRPHPLRTGQKTAGCPSLGSPTIRPTSGFTFSGVWLQKKGSFLLYRFRWAQSEASRHSTESGDSPGERRVTFPLQTKGRRLSCHVLIHCNLLESQAARGSCCWGQKRSEEGNTGKASAGSQCEAHSETVSWSLGELGPNMLSWATWALCLFSPPSYILMFPGFAGSGPFTLGTAHRVCRLLKGGGVSHSSLVIWEFSCFNGSWVCDLDSV